MTRRRFSHRPKRTRRGGGWGISGNVPDIKEKHTWSEFKEIVDEFTKYGYDDFLVEHKKIYDEQDMLEKEGKRGTKRWQLLDDVIHFNLMLMGNACRFVCPSKEPPVVVHKHWRERGNEPVLPIQRPLTRNMAKALKGEK
jgi:hypothetical protein